VGGRDPPDSLVSGWSGYNSFLFDEAPRGDADGQHPTLCYNGAVRANLDRAERRLLHV
jgi:hypothetical protein